MNLFFWTTWICLNLQKSTWDSLYWKYKEYIRPAILRPHSESPELYPVLLLKITKSVFVFLTVSSEKWLFIRQWRSDHSRYIRTSSGLRKFHAPRWMFVRINQCKRVRSLVFPAQKSRDTPFLSTTYVRWVKRARSKTLYGRGHKKVDLTPRDPVSKSLLFSRLS